MKKCYIESRRRGISNKGGKSLTGNFLLKHIIEEKVEGRIEVTERQERRCKQLLDDLRENRGYCKLKEE